MIRFWLAAVLAGWLLVTPASAERILSAQASAALWTIGPGDELYAAFGHSALRITDPEAGFDRLYNFGTFDFATPHFYLKFIRGDLDYFLTAAITPEVLEEYQASHQLVIEQQLNLSPAELDELFLAMEENLEPAHSAYRYDFVRDNCTTRIRDAVARVAKVQWEPLPKKSPTLRQMVQPYVNDRPAIKTGINLLLGANMDHPASTQEAMFLPEDMKVAFDNATIHDEAGTRRLVKNSQVLLEGPKFPSPSINWVVLSTYVAAALGWLALYKKIGWPHWLDVALFSTAALVGCFLWFLWLGTRHWVLHENWNLLWAWPTHLVIWFFPRKFQKRYWIAYFVFIVLSSAAAEWIQRVDRTKWEVTVDFMSFYGIKLLLVARALAQSVKPDLAIPKPAL